MRSSVAAMSASMASGLAWAYTAAVELYRAMGMTLWLPDAETELAGLTASLPARSTD